MTAATHINYVPVTYRDYIPAVDEGFIYNSWLKSFRESPWSIKIPAQIYFANHKKVIAGILRESGVTIAANPESPEQIFGYGVWQPTTAGVTVLHYLYVKHTYRRMGIAADIVRTIRQLSGHDDKLPMVATHTAGVWELLREKWQLVYNPYMIGAK